MRRTGRPPLAQDDPSHAVCVKLPGKVFDEVQARARREQVTMPEVLRRALARSQEEDENSE